MAYDPKDPADVAAVQELIDAALEPIAAKNRQLLGEVKVLKKGATVDPEDLAKVEAERDDLSAKLADATKQVKTLTTTAETATKALEAETAKANKLTVDNTLAAALAEAKVAPHHTKAVAALLREQGVEVKDGVAMLGGKPASDFVKEWSQSDEGKQYITAPGNGGGGAPGSGGAGGAVNPWDPKTRDLDAQGKIYTENPTQAKALAAAHGVTL